MGHASPRGASSRGATPHGTVSRSREASFGEATPDGASSREASFREATPDGASSGEASFRERRTRVAVFAAYGVQGFCFAALVTHVPALQSRFGFSDAVLGLLLLAVPVVSGVGSVLAGSLGSRVGSALVLRIAQPAVCLSVLGVGASWRRPELFLALAAFGLFVGMVDAAAGIQGVLLEQVYRRSIMHGFFGVWSLAGILGALVSSLGAAEHVPLVAVLAAVAVGGIAVSAWTGRWLLPGGPAAASIDPVSSAPAAPVPAALVPEALVPEAPAWAPAASGFGWRAILPVGLLVMFMYVADAATANFSAHYVQNGLGGSDTLGPLAFGGYQLAMVIGRATADRLVGRWGPIAAARTGSVVAMAGLVGVVTASGPLPAIGGFFLLGLGLCPIAPQAFSWAGALDPRRAGVAVARINVFNYLGFLIGAPMIGLVTQAWNERLAFGLLAVVVGAIFALAPALVQRSVAAVRTPLG